MDQEMLKKLISHKEMNIRALRRLIETRKAELDRCGQDLAMAEAEVEILHRELSREENDGN